MTRNPRWPIYRLLMGDKYRRQKLKQDAPEGLEPEWRPGDDGQIHDKDELLEFLNGRIDGLLYAWDEITGWPMMAVAEELVRRERPTWRAEYWDWIDLSVVQGAEDEQQCPWCGYIYHEDELLWIDPPEWSDRDERLGVCDECAEPWIERDRIADAEYRRAEKLGGQTPIDSKR